MKRIILTGGGTAGHVTPNIALIPELQKRGYEIHYVGSKDGIEKKLMEEFDIPYYGISSGKLRRYFDVKNFTDPARILKGYAEAGKIIKKVKPHVIFSKGGFVTVPVVLRQNVKKYLVCFMSRIFRRDLPIVCAFLRQQQFVRISQRHCHICRKRNRTLPVLQSEKNYFLETV